MSAYAGGVTAPGRANGSVPQQAPHDAATGGGGTQSLQGLIRALETVQFDSSDDVRDFCEALRALQHRLAVEASLAAIELQGRMKAEAKAKGHMGIPNFDMMRVARNVAKELNRAAAHAADSAASAVKAWTTWEKELEPLMAGQGKPRKEFRF